MLFYILQFGLVGLLFAYACCGLLCLVFGICLFCWFGCLTPCGAWLRLLCCSFGVCCGV